LSVSTTASRFRADRDGSLVDYFHPHLNDIERSTAEIEGWILGAM
jgi:hypothetical protein